RRGATDKDLLDVRLRSSRDTADGGAVDRGIAPTQHGHSFFTHNAFHDALGLQALMFFDGEKNHAHTIGSGGGQSESQLGAFARKKFVGDLNQDAGAITGFGVAAASAAM